MVDIEKTTITMVTGDTAKILVSCKDSTGKIYTPAVGDTVRFAVKETYYSSVILMEIDIPTDTMILEINPEDTKSFAELSPSKVYVYDIEMTYANGDIDTFIRGKFILLGEVK